MVGLNGAGKTTLFNAISGLVPYEGTIRFDGQDKGMSGVALARGYRAMSRDARTVRRRDGVRKPRPWRLSPERRRARRSTRVALRTIPDPQIAAGANGARCRAANSDADHRTGADDAAQTAHPRRTHARSRARDPRAVFGGNGAPAADHADHRPARRTERHVRALPHADRVYVLEHARIIWEVSPVRFEREMGHGFLEVVPAELPPLVRAGA